jgi:hypothetical protein
MGIIAELSENQELLSLELLPRFPGKTYSRNPRVEFSSIEDSVNLAALE